MLNEVLDLLYLVLRENGSGAHGVLALDTKDTENGVDDRGEAGNSVHKTGELARLDVSLAASLKVSACGRSE